MLRPADARRRDVALAGLFTGGLLVGIVASLHLLVSLAGIRSPAEPPLQHLERGGRFERSGAFDAAVSEYEKALQLARASDSPRLVALAANRMSALRRRTGELADALGLAETALEAATRAGAAAESSEAHFNIGYAEASMGRAREALRAFDRSAAVASRTGDAGAQARALLQFGLTAITLERTESSREALERAAAAARRAGEPAIEAASVRGLGQIHSRLGETQQALERYAEARALLKPLGDAAGEAVLLNAIGQVYFDNGMQATALRSYEEARAIFHRLGHRQREAASLFEMGRCHLELGQYETAAQRFGAALRIYRELDNPRLQADVLGEMARLSELAGDEEAAFRRFDEAIALKRAAGDARFLAYALDEAARLHVDLGHLDTAHRYLEEALRLSREVRDPGAESASLYQMARASRAEGNLEVALAEAERSVAIVEDLRANVASHALRASFLSEVHARYFLVVELLARLDARRPGSGYGARAFAAAEMARARTLLDSLEEASVDVRAGVDPSLLAEERALRNRLNEAAHEQLVLGSGGDGAGRLEREIEELAEGYDRLQSRIRSASPRYAALIHPEAPSLEDVQSRFLDGATRVLAYALGPDSSFLWSVSREESTLFELPPRAEIDELAKRVHERLASVGSSGRAEAELAKLREIVLGPVGERALASARRLIVVTEGALNGVPFGALPLPSGEPLVSTTEIVRLPSLAVLPWLRAHRAERAHERLALVVADPVYASEDPRLPASSREAGAGRGSTGTRSFELARLLGSAREAETLAALGSPESVQVLSGLEASRERLAETDLSRYRVVHFATHGLVDEERPELSGIALSLVDEAGRPRDGLLRLEDIYNMNVPAELVVLSACETARGADVRGEGVVGLVRAFFYAGASSVIASAWRVDDEATAELMQRFYARFFAGEAKSTALREAQASMLTESKWRDPFYWAGFELQGDWR